MTPPTHITHPDNDTSHWSPARKAAYAQNQRLIELTQQAAMADVRDEEAIYAEIERVDHLTPLEYAAELDAAQAQADADSLAAEVARWAEQDDDYADWNATRESDRPL